MFSLRYKTLKRFLIILLPNIYQKMKIRFKKKRLKLSLIFEILFFILGTIAVISDSNNIFNYGYLIIGILYIGTYFFENNKQYLTIENGIISKKSLNSEKNKSERNKAD